MGKESSLLVTLARKAIDLKVLEGKVLPCSKIYQEETGYKAGVFVSLKKFWKLRGCIGTFEPVCSSVGEEVIQNAISSATRDPRFPSVTKDELGDIVISVDVLSKPEQVKGEEFLDPKRYGVIVKSGFRRGLLLPDLEGVDTVEDQVRICIMKAGIDKEEKVEYFRFEVKRYK